MRTVYILQNCCDVEDNLRQLYRRVAFNIAIGNSDDHFRNHGFLLTPSGWTLSPAYDMNPTLNDHQALLINSTTNHADLQILLDSSEEYMIGKKDAQNIISEVKEGVKHWRSIASRLGIAKREVDVFEQVFQCSPRWIWYEIWDFLSSNAMASAEPAGHEQSLFLRSLSLSKGLFSNDKVKKD